MPKTRRLTDLYVTGADVTFEDEKGSLTVWVQKLNPVDQETALRRANAARSRILAIRSDPESPEYVELQIEVEDMDHEALVNALVDDALAKKRLSVEAELAAEEEWSKDGYLQGLNDVWRSTLGERYAETPEDPEAKRVFEELKRFSGQVEDRLQSEREALVKEFDDRDDAELREKVWDLRLNFRADIAWLREYRYCEVWLATRSIENHRERYFISREEVDELEQPVLTRLMDAYQAMAVDVTEGKGLEETRDSSPSSEQSEVAGTAVSSGQTGAAA